MYVLRNSFERLKKNHYLLPFYFFKTVVQNLGHCTNELMLFKSKALFVVFLYDWKQPFRFCCFAGNFYSDVAEASKFLSSFGNKTKASSKFLSSFGNKTKASST